MVESNPAIAQMQQFLKSTKPLGIGYSGPINGIMTDELRNALSNLEVTLSSKTGTNVSLHSANSVSSSAVATVQKLLGGAAPETKPQVQDSNHGWETFLAGNLPAIGTVASGDLATSAKKLEAAIGAAIGKPMNGVIWNDAKKSFNTTPDDVRQALLLIEAHKNQQPKQAKYTLDQRFLKLSQILTEKS